MPQSQLAGQTCGRAWILISSEWEGTTVAPDRKDLVRALSLFILPVSGILASRCLYQYLQ
jgi:hypothetical protein